MAVVCITIFSCQTLAKNKYDIGRTFSFRSKQAYYDYLKKKSFLPAGNILYPDSASYVKFTVEKIQQDSSLVYQGTYLNDSVYVKKSSFLQDNKSCSGRIQGEIETNISLDNYPDSILKKGTKMSSYNLYHLQNNQPFNVNSGSGKLKIYLLYAYGFGTYYDNFFKDVNEIQKKYAHKAELYFICLEPLYFLK